MKNADFAQVSFIGSGEIVQLDLGFIPDFVMMIKHGTTNDDIYTYLRIAEDDYAATLCKYGEILTGSTGVVTIQTTKASGIFALDTTKKTPTINDWAVGLALTAKTATSQGTLIRPSASSGKDRSNVFEVTVANTTPLAATEPDWDKAPALGDTILDNESTANTLERVNVSLEVKPAQGIQIASGLATNDSQFTVMAWRAAYVKAFGDAVAYPVGSVSSSRILSA